MNATHRIHSITRLAVVTSVMLALVAGCPPAGNDGGNGGNVNGNGSGGDEGVLMGQVWSVDGIPIPGVSVTLDNGRSASTEDHGFYSFSDLTPCDTIVAQFRRSGFAST